MSYVATIGFFDGVHSGHRYLIDQVVSEARERGLQSLIITFAEHPRTVLGAGGMHLLTTASEKEALLRTTPADRIEMLHFTREMSQMTAREFMRDVLYEAFNVRVLVIGYDHRFGHNRSEGFEDYVRYGKEIGMEVVLAQEYEGELKYSSTAVRYSSTAVRTAISIGDMAAANAILSYPYFLQGTVTHGHHVGSKIGFPTANLTLPADKLVPASGVYAVKAVLLPLPNPPQRGLNNSRTQELKNSKTHELTNSKTHELTNLITHPGMLNIGYRPTLDNGKERSIEVHIFDFDHDIYGQSLRLELMHFVRPERKFSSIDELKHQLADDEITIREFFKQN